MAYSHAQRKERKIPEPLPHAERGAGRVLMAWALVFGIWLAAIFSSAFAQATLQERGDLLLNSLSTRSVNTGQHDGPHRAGRTGFWTTEGRLARGKSDTTTWNYLRAALDDVDGLADAGGANGGFSGWPGMDCWYRFNQVFPQDLKDKYQAKYTTMPTYHSGSTPNQKVMWAVACRLACEYWGTNATTSVTDADYTKSGDKTGKDYLMGIFKKTVRQNFEERWAKHYLTYSLGPFRTLADFTSDEELRRHARMTLDFGWADLAPVNFHGRWAVSAGRGGISSDGNGYDISEFNTWLVMGGPSPSSLLDADQSCYYIMPGAPDPPVASELIDIGNNRDQPYTTRRMARLFETQFATTYMTKDYAVYSQVEGDSTVNPDGTIKIKDLDNAGVPSNDWNSERWGVLWNDAPDNAGAGLTMKPPTDYGWALGSGVSPYEDVVQHEGTIVGILNIPAGKNQYTKDTIPTNALAVINDTATTGRLFLHYKTVLVAIFRSDPGVFQYPAPSTSVCVKRGFAVETASPSEYPQATAAERLAAFRADVLAHAADASGVSGVSPRMIYTKRDGTVLDITYGQAGRINNDPVDYESWPLTESPWTSMQQMGNLFVMGGNRTVLRNYNDWSERVNNRPTATANAPVTGLGNGTVDIDLSARVADAETPANALKFRIIGASNGSAEILADGRTARFTSAGNLVGTAALTFSAGDAFPDRRLIFHYDYEESNSGGNGTVADVSSQDRHATTSVVGTASLSGSSSVPSALTGASRQSLQAGGSAFGGAKLSRQVYPALVNLSNGDWTFSTWFKRAGFSDDDFLLYIGSGDGFGGNGDELQLYLPAQSKTLALRHYDASNAQDVNVTSAPVIEAETWHHAAVRFDRSGSNSGTVTLFLDGQAVGSSVAVTWALSQSGPVFIGGPALNTVPARCLSGALDDTALFRGKLTDGEVAELATGTVAHLGGLKVVQTIPIASVPLAPPDLSASLVNNAVSLTWGPVAGATSYTVKRGNALAGPFTLVAAGLPGNGFVDTSAGFGATYYYQVTATNAAGEGSGSNVAAVTLPANDPTLWNSGLMSGWSRGARIAFPGYTANQTLTNFPVLVAIDGTKIPGFAYSQCAFPNGADLRFTDASGTSELSYEIDTWNPAGTSYVWVRVPSLAAGSAICAFWGNPASPAPAGPDSIPNLSMWLKADAITGLADGATVTAWPDSSGNSRNATLLSGAPAFKTNALNGRPVVRFAADGESGFSFPQMSDIRTVFWVVKETSTTGIHFLLGDDDRYAFHRGTGGPIWSASNTSSSIRGGTTRLMGASVNGTTTALGTGYRIVSVVTSGAVEASRLCKDRSIAGRSWDGDVAEVIVYNRALTASEEALVGGYLAQKYALATSYPGVPPACATDGSTWSEGYLGVFHLRETSGQHLSSTAGAAPTRVVSATSQGNATGIIGGADKFNGTSGYVSLPDFGNSTQVTVEAWVNLSATPTDTYGAGIVSTDPWSAGTTFFEVQKDRTLAARINGAGTVASAAAAVPLGTWSHVAYTISGNASNGLSLYQDGALLGTAAGHSANNLTDVNIAREYSGRYLNGTVDEVRISSVARPAAWIAATRANMVAPSAFNRSSPAFLSPAPVAPPTVATLAATGIGPTTSVLNGNLASAGGSATAVKIYWGTANGGTASGNWTGSLDLGPLPVGAFSGNLTGLAPGSRYFFRAYAGNSSGGTWAPETLEFTTTTAVPVGLSASGNAGTVRLTWNAAPGAASYNVKRATVSGGPYSLLQSGILGASFEDRSLSPGQTVYYVVSALNSGGESQDSSQVSATAVAAPATLTATAGNASVALSWGAVAGAASYTVKRATAANGPYTVLQSGLVGTTATDASAANGTTYYYAVHAVANGFESAGSPVATALPLAGLAAPSGVRAIADVASADLSWTPVSNALAYSVKRATVSGGPYTVVAGSVLGASFTDSGLTTGATYYYVISATAGSVESANSAQVTVVPATRPTTFTCTTAGGWGNVTWSPNPPGQPLQGASTVLVFNNSTAISSQNNLGTFLCHALQLNNRAVALTGGALYFTGNGSALTTSGSDAHSISNPLALDSTTSFAISANTTTISGAVSGPGGITKTGAGALVLAAGSSCQGATVLDGGTLRIGSDATMPGSVTFGAAPGSSNASSLDLSAASASFGPLILQGNSTSNNTMTIGPGKSVTFLGDVRMGTWSSASNASCTLSVNGTGTLSVVSPTGSFLIGKTSSGSGVNNTLNLSGVAKFVLDYGEAGELVLGNLATGSGVNTLVLAPDSTLVVGAIRLGDYQVPSSAQTLKLGTSENRIYTNSISLGTTASPTGGGRGVGVIQFLNASGNVTIRDFGGVGGADLLIADDGSSGNGYGTVNLNGHPADVKLHLLRMGASTSPTARNHAFSFNQGTLEIRAVDIGILQASGYPQTSTINLGGGNVTLGLGDADDPGSIVLATNAVGILNITGGNVTIHSDIVEAPGTGSATVTLSGGSLDLNGHAIGGTTANQTITFLNLQSGTLKNVAGINNGAGFTKSGNGTLSLAGTNTPGGNVTIGGGVLQIASGGSFTLNGTIGGAGSFAIATGGTLGGCGTVGTAVSCNGTLAPAAGGTLSLNGSLTIGGGARIRWTLTDNSTDATASGRIAVTGTFAARPVDVVLNDPASGVDFANAFWSQPHTWPLAGAGNLSGNFTVGSVSGDSLASPVDGYGRFSIQQTLTSASLVWTPLSAIEQWRFIHFGISTNTGIASDDADPDGDGLVNLLEYALLLPPTSPSRPDAQISGDETNLAFSYSRNRAAVGKVAFTVEWSETLVAGSWSTAGAVETDVSPDPNSALQAIRATGPAGSGSKRFVRLRVTALP